MARRRPTPTSPTSPSPSPRSGGWRSCACGRSEDRVEADLALGRHADVIDELDALVAQQPLRERLRGQLMVALYRSGRQAEALRTYGEGRRVLADELGIDPGPGAPAARGMDPAPGSPAGWPGSPARRPQPVQGAAAVRRGGQRRLLRPRGARRAPGRTLRGRRPGRPVPPRRRSERERQVERRTGRARARDPGRGPAGFRTLAGRRDAAGDASAPGARGRSRGALGSRVRRRTLAEALDRDGDIAGAVARVLPDHVAHVVLVVDQLEELWSLVDDETERTRFVTGLVEALSARGSRLLVVATLRADFLDRPLRSPGLGELVRAGYGDGDAAHPGRAGARHRATRGFRRDRARAGARDGGDRRCRQPARGAPAAPVRAHRAVRPQRRTAADARGLRGGRRRPRRAGPQGGRGLRRLRRRRSGDRPAGVPAAGGARRGRRADRAPGSTIGAPGPGR